MQHNIFKPLCFLYPFLRFKVFKQNPCYSGCSLKSNGNKKLVGQLHAGLYPMDTMALPIIPSVQKQPRGRMPEYISERKFSDLFDHIPVVFCQREIIGPENIVPQNPEKLAVLIELDLIRMAPLTGINGISLMRKKISDQPMKHYAGLFVMSGQQQSHHHHGMIPDPFTVVLPDTCIGSSRPGDHSRQLVPGRNKIVI